MRRRLTPLLVAASLLAAACASEGLPNSYVDQDKRAERQFVEACEAALAEADDPPSDPAAYCRCAFYTVAAELSFAEFLELDEKLKNDPEALSLEERTLLESVSLPCAFGEDDINTATTS